MPISTQYHLKGWWGESTRRKLPFCGFAAWIPLLLALNIPAQTETPAVALFLDALEDRRLEGRLSEAQFTALSLELDESFDCPSLRALALEWDQSAVDEAVAQACLESHLVPVVPTAPKPKSIRAQWTQALYPQAPDRDGFALTADAHYADFRVGGAFRDTALVRRYVEAGFGFASGNRISLHAGNLQYTLPDMRIALVSGRRAPAGLRYREGPALLFASHPGMNGLGVGFTGKKATAAAHASWNKAYRGQERVDLLQYGAGARLDGETISLTAQNLLVRYETDNGRASDYWIGGLEGRERKDKFRAGLGYTFSRDGESLSGPESRLGFVAEAEVKHKGSQRRQNSLRVFQATPDWENPLAPAWLRYQDTTASGFKVAGSGEGGLVLRSRIPLGEAKGSPLLQADSELGWLWMRQDWLRQGFRLGLEQKWGAFQTQADWRWDQAQNWNEDFSGEDFSHWTLGGGTRYRAEKWRAALRYSHRGEGYRGLFPRSLQGDIAWLRKNSDALRLGWQTGDVLKPLSRNRIYFSQDFDITPGLRLTGIVRVPLAEGSVEKSFYYRLQVRASY